MANIDTKTFLNPDAIGKGTITGAKIKNETIWPNKLAYPTINSAFADANSDGINLATNVGPVEVASMFDNNVAFYAKADGIKVEYSRDGGENWYEYNINNYDNNVRKVNMVSGITTNYYAGGCNHQILDTTTGELSVNADSSRTHGTKNDMLRFTFDAKGMGIYAMIMQIYVLVSTSGSYIEENGSYTGKLHVKLEASSMKSLDNFVPITDKITVTGWSGWNAIPINRRFGSSGWNTNDDYTGRFRLTFYCDEVKSTTEWFSVWQFKFLSSDAWAFPSEMAKNNHLYEAGIRDITYGNDNYGNPGLIATPSMILPGEIKPKTTDKYDNGTSTQQWRNIYGQNIYGGNLYENGTTLSNKYAQKDSTQKAVYDYINTPANICDTTTSPNLLGPGSTFGGIFAFYDTKFYNTQNATSNRAQVAYGCDNDFIAFRRYYNGAWNNWKKVAFVDNPNSVTVRLYSNSGIDNIGHEVIGYNGSNSDIVNVTQNTSLGRGEIVINSSLVDCIIDNIYGDYIVNGYDIFLPRPGGECAGKTIKLIKNNEQCNDSLELCVYVINRSQGRSDNFLVETTTLSHGNNNIDLKVKQYKHEKYIYYTSSSNPTNTGIKNIFTITFTSNGSNWIVSQE